jgi:DNA-binding MarR family transcriptional regulator
MSSSTPPLTLGRTVALAQQALTSLLAESLAKAGTTPLAWLALDRIATDGPADDVEALRASLAPAERTYPGSAADTIQTLVADGLIAAGPDRVELTPAGEARYRELRAATAAVTERVLAPFDQGEIQAAARTLVAVTEHARTVQGTV